MSVIRLINNDTDLQAAQAELERLLEIDQGERTAEQSQELGILIILIEHYEDEHYAIDLPDPIEAIWQRMDELGLNQVDLLAEFSNKTTASQMLSRTRPLTLPVIRRLAARLGLPLDLLTQEYPLVAGASADEADLTSAMG